MSIKTRFFLTMFVAFVAIIAIGVIPKTLGTVIILLLPWGLGFISALIFFVLPSRDDADPQRLSF